jgi:acyl-CoA dehydrogenase
LLRSHYSHAESIEGKPMSTPPTISTLTDEQQLLVTTVRRFIEEHCKPLEAEVEHHGSLPIDKAKALLQASLSVGLYCMHVKAEFGGGGLSAFERMLVEEQFGRTTDILVRRSFGNVYETLYACSPAQASRWLVPSVTGERTGSIAITEPDAGSDASAIRTKAVRTTDGWTLTGMKHFISDGLWSDYFIVSALTDGGISLFVVDKAADGVTIGRDQPMMGLRGTSHTELFFDDVLLTDENLLGLPGTGLRQILTTLGVVRLAQVGARSVGKATMILEKTIEHAANRNQFGAPIGNLQMVQQMIADSIIDVNRSRLLLQRAAVELDQGGDGRNWIAMVKVDAAEMLNRVADRAVQIFGGMGYCKDLDIERYYRDARITRIYDGASEVHRMTLARNALKANASMFDLV